MFDHGHAVKSCRAQKERVLSLKNNRKPGPNIVDGYSDGGSSCMFSAKLPSMKLQRENRSLFRGTIFHHPFARSFAGPAPSSRLPRPVNSSNSSYFRAESSSRSAVVFFARIPLERDTCSRLPGLSGWPTNWPTRINCVPLLPVVFEGFGVY